MTTQHLDFSMEQAMSVAIEAAEAAGQVLRDMLTTASVREKGPKDLVTDADVAAQNAIQEILFRAFPEHGFLGEECHSANDATHTHRSKEWQWVVDPLDGTANYVHRLPNFAVSIALLRGSESLLGVVLDPMARETYTALKGRGAAMNGTPIRASSCRQLDAALVAASFPPQIRKDSLAVHQFVEILVRSQSVRRLGSAALNLCYVAHGRLDGYWAGCLKPWDIAAGALIAMESGAIVTQLNGEAFDPWLGELLATSTESLGDEMRECLSSVKNETL
jgi:myo-inositol-1(or 4)-monophosphatase